MTKVIGAIGLALAIGLAGCTNTSGPTGSGGGSVGEGDGGGGGDREPVSSTSSLLLVNDSSISIWYLYVSPSSSSSWGGDQLGANVVSPGERFTLRSIPCGQRYDLKVEGSGHATLATSYGVYFACGETMTWRLY